MLEKVPEALGEALSGVRAGIEATLFERQGHLPAIIEVTSPAFAEGGTMDARFTEDGAGISPPLAWRGMPATTVELLLLVEDVDSPTPRPIVHAVVHRLAGHDGGIAEGALGEGSAAYALGPNTFLKPGWLPPDPPTGHGAHRYCFQLFALGTAAGLPDRPGRGAIAQAVQEHGIARGRLIGCYARG